ncbi:hypothetical protein CFE70_002271 [Pyrenophora teres f. teres 0-1]
MLAVACSQIGDMVDVDYYCTDYLHHGLQPPGVGPGPPTPVVRPPSAQHPARVRPHLVTWKRQCLSYPVWQRRAPPKCQSNTGRALDRPFLSALRAFCIPRPPNQRPFRFHAVYTNQAATLCNFTPRHKPRAPVAVSETAV